jgi:capsular exopolysaccharide synthesis family protein
MNDRPFDNSGGIGEGAQRAASIPIPLQKRALWLAKRYWAAYLLALAVSAAVSFASDRYMPSFRSQAILNLQAAINNPLQSLSARLGGFSGFDVDGREVDRYISRLRIRSYFTSLARQVKSDKELVRLRSDEFYANKSIDQAYREHRGSMGKTKVADLTEEELVRRLPTMITFAKDGIDAVSIHVAAASRTAAYRLTNLAAETAVQTLIDFEEQDLKDSDVYLKIQARRNQESIEQTESSIAQFKKKKKLFTINNSFDDANLRATEIQRQLTEVDLNLQETKLEEAEIRKRAPAGVDEIPEDYKYSMPRKIASLHKATEELESRGAGLRKLLTQLHDRYDENAEQEILDLRKNLDLENSLDQELKKHDFQMEMRRISARNKFRILELARLDQVQVGETLQAKLLVSLFASIMLISFFGYFHETSFPLVRDRLSLRDEQLNVIGGVPDGRGFLDRVLRRNRSESHPKMTRLMTDRVASCFYHIASKIVAARDRAKPPAGTVISVTSAQPHEGKSFCAQKLAEALALSGQRVLLVDADLRSPMLSVRFRCRKDAGLVEVIRNPQKFGELRVAQVSPRLDLLPAGRKESGASLVLLHPGFRAFLQSVNALYDFVLIDCPPVSVSDDAGSVASLAQMPLLVAGFGEVSLRGLRVSVEQLSGEHGVGVNAILNKVPLSEWSSYGGYRRAGLDLSHSAQAEGKV